MEGQNYQRPLLAVVMLTMAFGHVSWSLESYTLIVNKQLYL